MADFPSPMLSYTIKTSPTMQGTTQKQVLKNWMVAKYSLPPSTQTHEEKISGKPGSLLESRLGCNEVRAAGF